eukprot:m.895975 g.895975  ORF g.895975 m.895975 type:complete len:400 (-) comp60004_c0_seq3:278-1477(-)
MNRHESHPEEPPPQSDNHLRVPAPFHLAPGNASATTEAAVPAAPAASAVSTLFSNLARRAFPAPPGVDPRATAEQIEDPLSSATTSSIEILNSELRLDFLDAKELFILEDELRTHPSNTLGQREPTPRLPLPMPPVSFMFDPSKGPLQLPPYPMPAPPIPFPLDPSLQAPYPRAPGPFQLAPGPYSLGAGQYSPAAQYHHPYHRPELPSAHHMASFHTPMTTSLPNPGIPLLMATSAILVSEQDSSTRQLSIKARRENIAPRFPAAPPSQQHNDFSDSDLILICDICNSRKISDRHQQSIRWHRSILVFPVPEPLRSVCGVCQGPLDAPVPNILPSGFTCQSCNKVFDKSSRLLAHSSKHSQTKPFRCLTCWKTFTRLHRLKQHVKRYHEEEEEEEQAS